MPEITEKAGKFCPTYRGMPKNRVKPLGRERRNRITVKRQKIFRRREFRNIRRSRISVMGANLEAFVTSVNMIAQLDAVIKFASMLNGKI